MSNKKDSVIFSIRIFKSLRERIKIQAKLDGGRSANSLIVSILEAGIKKIEREMTK